MAAKHNSLSACYEDYINTCTHLQETAKPLDGIFGLRSSQKTHPCHDEFFYEVQEICTEIANDPGITAVRPFAELILFKPKEEEGMLSYWYMLAAQQHVMLLLPKLSPDETKELLDRYVKEFPKKDWMPVHVKLVKTMKKRVKGK